MLKPFVGSLMAIINQNILITNAVTRNAALCRRLIHHHLLNTIWQPAATKTTTMKYNPCTRGGAVPTSSSSSSNESIQGTEGAHKARRCMWELVGVFSIIFSSSSSSSSPLCCVAFLIPTDRSLQLQLQQHRPQLIQWPVTILSMDTSQIRFNCDIAALYLHKISHRYRESCVRARLAAQKQENRASFCCWRNVGFVSKFLSTAIPTDLLQTSPV